MNQIQTFFAMGGYGAFVWPAFGATALILIWLLASSLRRLRALERQLEAHHIAHPGGGGRGRSKATRPSAGEGAAP